MVQKCKLTQELVSSPDTTAYLSPVALLPDVHESPNDVHPLSLCVGLSFSLLVSPVFRKEDGICALPEVDSQLCCASTQAHNIHTLIHTLRARMDHIWKPSDRQQVTAPRPAAPAPPLLSCPSPEQPLNSLLPQHSNRGKQSAPEVHHSHTRWCGRWIEPLY